MSKLQAGIFYALLAILVVGLSTNFAHGDMHIIAWFSRMAAEHLNVYDYFAKTHPEYLESLTYPPLVYWLIGYWMKLGALLGIVTQTSDGLAYLTRPEMFWYRLPLIAAFVAAGFSARRIAARLSGRSDLPTSYFMMQPVVLISAFIMGQFDILPTLTILLAFELLLSDRVVGAFAMLSIGTMLKNFPGVIAAVFAVSCFLTPKRRSRALIGCIVFAAIVAGVLAPVYGPSLKQSYLAFKHMNYVLKLVTPGAPGGIYLREYLGIISVILVLGLMPLPSLTTSGRWLTNAMKTFRNSEKRRGQVEFLVVAALMAAIFIDRNWMPQYVTWFSPWLIMLAVVPTVARRISPKVLPLVPLFSLCYLLAVPGDFPHNVDSNTFLNASASHSLSALIHQPGYFWIGVSAICLFAVVLAVIEALAALTEPTSTTPASTTSAKGLTRLAWLQLAISYIALAAWAYPAWFGK